jgi:hypothetical protein
LSSLDLLRLRGHDGASRLSIGETPVSRTLSGHTEPHGSCPDGRWSHHRIEEGPQGNPHSQQSSGWGAVSRTPPGREVYELVLGFRARLNRIEGNPLVKPAIGVGAPFRLSLVTRLLVLAAEV